MGKVATIRVQAKSLATGVGARAVLAGSDMAVSPDSVKMLAQYARQHGQDKARCAALRARATARAMGLKTVKPRAMEAALTEC